MTTAPIRKLSAVCLSLALILAQAAGPACSQIERADTHAGLSLAQPGLEAAALPLQAAPLNLDFSAIAGGIQNVPRIEVPSVDLGATKAAQALPAARVPIAPQPRRETTAIQSSAQSTGNQTKTNSHGQRISSFASPVKNRAAARLKALSAGAAALSAASLKLLFDSGSASSSKNRSPMIRAGFTEPAIRPLPRPNLPKGTSLDLPPGIPNQRRMPAPALGLINTFSIPDTEIINQSEDVVLNADPQSAESVERALRTLIDQDPQYGIKSSDLSTAYVHRVEVKDQIPTWEILLRQTRQSQNADGSSSSLPVYGSGITFIIHERGGKPAIRGVHGRLFPNIAVDAAQKISAQDMVSGIRKRLRISSAETSPAITLIGRQVVYLERGQEKNMLDKILGVFGRKTGGTRQSAAATGSWHAVNIYKIQNVDAFAAVDIASGRVFLWDMRLGAAGQKSAQTAGAQFDARVPLADHDMTSPPHLRAVPLPLVAVRLADGRELQADDAGRVQVEIPDGTSMKVTARLDSRYLGIVNKSGQNVEVEATLVAGKKGPVVVFNPPAGASARKRLSPIKRAALKAAKTIYRGISPEFRIADDAQTKKTAAEDLMLAQVTTYVAGYTFMNWNKAHGIGDKDGIWNQKYLINVNIDDNCNAYMDPSDMSRNFFQAGGGCINTGTLPGVVYHESGHLSHYMVAGYAPGQAGEVLESLSAQNAAGSPISVMPYVDGGLSEGIGDMFATYMEKTPLIGEHFFTDPKQPYLRTAENTYQFNPNDEVHEQGLAWMGFAWKIRTLLSTALGEAAGTALAENLLFPHLYGYATAQDIPTAMNVVYLAATALTSAAKAAALKAVQAAAAAHGVPLGPPEKTPGKKQPGLASVFNFPGAAWLAPAYA
ncbi:MAG: hypothetical protein ACYCPQ_01960 [Elusimicrobiota bacterium]